MIKTSEPSARLRWATAAAFFIIVSLIFTWPLLPNINRQIAGETDAFQLLGSTYNAAKTWQPSAFLNPLELPKLFSVSTHIQIFHQVFGEPLGYNLFWLMSFVLTGLGTYCLGYYLTKQHLAALIAGLVLTLSPLHFAYSSGFYGIGHFEWVPLYILFLIKYFRKPSVRLAILASVFFLLTAAYDVHGIYIIGLFTAALMIYEVIQNPSILKNRRFKIVTLAALGFVLLYILVENRALFQLASASQSLVKPSLEEVITYSNDVAGFVIPYAYHPVWGGFFWQHASSGFIRSIGENTNYVGVIVLVLTTLGLAWRRRMKMLLFWFGIAIGFALLSLGPFLKAAGVVEPKIPLPYLWLYHWVPFTDIIRGVGRFFTVGMLAFSLLAAYGASGVLLRIKSERRRMIFASLIMACIAFEFLAVPRLSDIEVPAFYRQLAQESGDFNIIQIPSVTSYNPASYLTYYNSQHDKGIIGKKSYFSRDQYDEDKLADIRSTPVIGTLLYDLPKGETPLKQVLKQDYRAVGQTVFRQYNVKYIVLHKNFITDNAYIGYGILKDNYDLTKKFIESSLSVKTHYEDQDTLVYQVEPYLTSADDLYLKLGDSWESSTDPVSWQPFILGRSNSTLTIQNNSLETKKLALNLRLNAICEPVRLGIKHQGSLIGDYGILERTQTITIYLDDIPIGASAVSLSVRDWNDKEVDGVIFESGQIKVTDISYDTIDAINAPDIIKQITDEFGDFSIIQLAAANTYSFDPARWGDKTVFGKRLITAESPAGSQIPSGASTDTSYAYNQPVMEHLFGRMFDHGWEKINSIRAYSELYYYLQTDKILHQNQVKYILVKKSIFTAEELNNIDFLIKNFTDVSEKVETDDIDAYQLDTENAILDTPDLLINGKAFGNRNNKLTSGSDVVVQINGADWAHTTLNGRITNPTEQVRRVLWKRSAAPLISLDLEPGVNKFSLNLDQFSPGNETLTFIDQTQPQFNETEPVDYQLSQIELYPDRFESLADYVGVKLRARSEDATINFEGTDYQWNDLQGAPTPIRDQNGNQAVSLKPSCDHRRGVDNRCVAQVRHYFTDFTAQAEVEAFIKLDRWPEDGRVALRFVQNGEEHTALTSPTSGEGHSPLVSAVFAHDFKVGEWNSLKITYQPGGEFALYENGVPLFWCQNCVESRPLGFFVQLETADQDARMDVDFIQYDRAYLKPE